MNSTCSITSIHDLLDKANRNLLNISTTIASCPDICSQAWGKGDPDLLGIGVYTSYMMQVALTFICGPILGFVYRFRHRLGNEEDIEHRLVEIHKSSIDISVGFNIPVGVAAAIRSGYSPIFEQSFLRALIFIQSYSFVTVVMTVLVFEDPINPLLPMWYSMIQLLLLLILSASYLRGSHFQISDNEWLENCKAYTGIDIPASDFAWFHIIVWAVVAICGLIFGLMILFNCIQTPRMFKEWRGIKDQPNLAGPFIVMVPWIGIMAFMVYTIEDTRNHLKSVASQDDLGLWGFGQLIAVSLWIPLCFKVTYFGIRLVLSASLSCCNILLTG